MARTELLVQESKRSGTQSTAVAADSANGMKFANDGKTVLEVLNGGGASINVTATEVLTVDGVATTGRVAACANGAFSTLLGPYPPNVYNQLGGSADPGYVYIDFSAATSVTVRAIRPGSQ